MIKRQEDVSELLGYAMYVIVVLDGWSSRKMESYMGLVANLIMPSGNEHTLVLTCRHFPQRHTTVNLAKWFQDELSILISNISSYVLVQITQRTSSRHFVK